MHYRDLEAVKKKSRKTFSLLLDPNFPVLETPSGVFFFLFIFLYRYSKRDSFPVIHRGEKQIFAPVFREKKSAFGVFLWEDEVIGREKNLRRKICLSQNCSWSRATGEWCKNERRRIRRGKKKKKKERRESGIKQMRRQKKKKKKRRYTRVDIAGAGHI